MTNQIQSPDVAKNQAIVNALIASGGDINLVAEQINMSLPPNTQQVQNHEILDIFIRSISEPNSESQNSLRGMLLLQLLSILTEAKSKLIESLDDFSPSETLRTIQLVVEGVAQLLPQPKTEASGTGVNVNFMQQFNSEMEGTRDRVNARLETYKKLGEAYSDAPVENDDTNTST